MLKALNTATVREGSQEKQSGYNHVLKPDHRDIDIWEAMLCKQSSRMTDEPRSRYLRETIDVNLPSLIITALLVLTISIIFLIIPPSLP